MANNAMEQIKHLVVVMMENRSFDNLLGFLYADVNNQPPINIPAPPPGGQTAFDGLEAPSPMGPFWNPSNAEFFTAGAPPVKVFASQGTTGPKPFLVPDPDPHEDFDRITYQILGPNGWTGSKMMGFVVDYKTPPKESQTPDVLMQSYSPGQVSVLSGLARNYAVCDAWFCSAPMQTLPNRAFAHAGTSMGRVNNTPKPLYDAETIFEVLEATGHTWKVYNDTFLMSCARLQFPQLWNPLFQRHFVGMKKFEKDAAAGRLPEYSFVEPSFQISPNDEHPPHDVSLGEQFLLRVWKAVSEGKAWNNTLLVITFDEHGGCYDHVVPPPAVPPDADSNPGEKGFHFDRYGVRVPTVLVSPYIQAGTVFRHAKGKVPYDHTSILAALRDWLHIPQEKMLTSRRVAEAPTFADILTRSTPRSELPAITLARTPKRVIIPQWYPENDLQKVMITAHLSRYRHGVLTNWPKFKRLNTPPPTARVR